MLRSAWSFIDALLLSCLLGLFCFLIYFCPLVPVVRWHSGVKFSFFNISFYVLVNTLFQMLLESCSIWGDVKGKCTDSSI